MPNLAETLSVQQLKDQIAEQIEVIPEDGITTEDGSWISKEDEQERLRKLYNDIAYFLWEYAAYETKK